ncbi:MAG: hypothetical protein AAFN59_05635, partial [Pseudomonadota bacterium]
MDPSNADLVEDACERFRKAMLRPRRRHLAGFIATSLVLFVIALIPIGFAVVASLMVPDQGIARGAPNTVVSAHNIYVAQVRFWCVLVVFVGLLAFSLFAQCRAIDRHWRYMWHDLDRTPSKPHLSAMTWMPIASGGLFFACVLLAWPLLDLPGTLEQTLLIHQGILAEGYGFAIGAGLVAATLSLSHLTLIATSTAAGHYPSSRRIDQIYHAFDRAKNALGDGRDAEDVLAAFFFEGNDPRKALRSKFAADDYLRTK